MSSLIIRRCIYIVVIIFNLVAFAIGGYDDFDKLVIVALFAAIAFSENTIAVLRADLYRERARR